MTTEKDKARASDNELIAQFMGMTSCTCGEGELHYKWGERNWEVCSLETLKKYQTSWDWLMPVVEKIETQERTLVYIYSDATKIWVDDKDGYELFATAELGHKDSKIEHVYRAVVKFIKWHNEQR